MAVQALEVPRQGPAAPAGAGAVPRWFALALLAPGAALLLVLQAVVPWALPAAGLCVLFTLLVYRHPLFGVAVWFALYPMHSINFVLYAYGLQSILKNAVFIYPVEIMNALLLLVLAAQQLDRRQQAWNRRELPGDGTCRWLLYLAALFTLLTACVVAASENVLGSAIGGWRFVGNFFAVAFIVVHLRRLDQFVRVALLYVAIVVVCAALAIAATFYGFSNEYPLLHTQDFSLSAQVGIFNRGGHFFAPLSGMITGYGLSGKHELSMHMMAGMAFLGFFFARHRSGAARFLLALLLVLFTSINQQAFSKTSMGGSVLILAATVALVAPWRKHLAAALLVYAGVSLVGAAGAHLLRPEHQKQMSSVSAQLIKTSSSSRFEASSFGQRLYTWERSLERIWWSRGLGRGPDSSSANRDIAFGVPHGHNLFLTLALEFGVPATVLLAWALALVARLSHRRVFRAPRVRDPAWQLQLTLVVAVLLALFEYQFDVHVHYPQLWAMVGLLLAALRNLPGEAAGGPGAAPA